MAKPDAVFIYIGTYPSEVAARPDYDVIKDLHAAGVVGTYDAAVVTKDDAGKVHENKPPGRITAALRGRRHPGRMPLPTTMIYRSKHSRWRTG